MDKLTPFDKLTSTSQLQMMKLFIPYVAPETRQMLAVYIKFTELQNAMKFFTGPGVHLHSQDFEKQSQTPMQIFDEILPYMPDQISEQFEQIKGMMDMMEMMQGQDLSDMFQMFAPETPENKGGETDERMDE